MNEIRTLQPHELQESIALSQFAFQYELSAEQQAEQVDKMDPTQHLGYFKDGTLAA